MKLRASATILALFCLAACDRIGSPQARVDACIGSFAETLRGLPDVRPSSRGTVRYAFELRAADPALQREGIEGVVPSVFTEISSPGGPAMTREAVQRVMNEAPDPKVIPAPSVHQIRGAATWLIYAPERSFSEAEARRHLAAMCALSSRGLVLRSISVALPNGPH
jgi:hypothetical protein